MACLLSGACSATHQDHGDRSDVRTAMVKSQKTAEDIHDADLALYIDERHAAAHKMCDQLRGLG
jgi:hypothetical protein